MKIKFPSFSRLIISAISLSVFSMASFADEEIQEIPAASFAQFDARANAGSAMSVVFFGGSSTWGDGASDPERTSFRALLQNYLKEKYPAARFVFHNAAIGGTGSKLGMFRVNRDVLSRKPDLVFMDFTIEDQLTGTDRQTLASYEGILRDFISEGVPVVEILLGTKNYFGPDWTHLGPPRFRDHLEMGRLYHTGIGNGFTAIQNFLRNELNTRDEIWPVDQTHLSDRGHRLIFDETRAGLEKAIHEKQRCNSPREPVFADEYKNRLRFFPTSSPLPHGWRATKTLRPTLEAVDLANGRMNEVAICDVSARGKAKSLTLNFNGTFVGILGEADEHGLGFKIFIDGHSILYTDSEDDIWPTSSLSFGGGERFFWHEISDKLKPGRHTVEIQPVFPKGVEMGSLRIESICVAGDDPDATQSLSSGPVQF